MSANASAKGLSSARPRILQALPDALQDAGFFGLLLLSEQTHGRGDGLFGGGKRPLRTLAWTNCSRSAGNWVFI